MASKFGTEKDGTGGTVQSEELDIKVVSQALHKYFGKESRTEIIINFLTPQLEYFKGKLAKMFVPFEGVIIQPTSTLDFLLFQDSSLPQDKFALHVIQPKGDHLIVFAYQVFTSLPRNSQFLTSPYLSPEVRSGDHIPCSFMNIDKFLRQPDPVKELFKGLPEMFSPGKEAFEWTQEGADQSFSIKKQGLYWKFTEDNGMARIVNNVGEALIAELEFITPT